VANQQLYNVPGLDAATLAQALDQWFQQQEYETQVLEGPGEGMTVQARRHKSFMLRGSVALTVTITPQDDNLLIQAGQAKWALQAVEGVAALILFWPLLALPAYAAYKQKELIDDSMQFISQYITAAGGKPLSTVPMPPAPPVRAPQPPPPPETRCASCNQPLRAGAKFCDSCGAPVAAQEA